MIRTKILHTHHSPLSNSCQPFEADNMIVLVRDLYSDKKNCSISFVTFTKELSLRGFLILLLLL